MARILAIDYGKKRTGIAVSDPLKIIATALDTIDTHRLVSFLKDYFSKEEVEKVILGYPKNLNATDTNITAEVEKFFNLFKKIFPSIPIVLIDERFTSKMAFQSMIDSGISKKDRRNKALVDQISATILLQGYMGND